MKFTLYGKDSLENENNPINTCARNGRLTSSQYKFQSSTYIINQLKNWGFEMIGSSTGSPNLPENRGYQKHVMVFEDNRAGFEDRTKIDDGNKFRILVQNSHDGNSAVKFYVGIFRAACANGLIAGDATNYIKVNHKGKDFKKKIVAAIANTVHQFNYTKDAIRKLQRTLPSNYDIAAFRKTVVQRLLKGKDYIFSDQYSLTNRRRKADMAPDLYTIFNVIQENVLSGGMTYHLRSKMVDGELKAGRIQKTQKIAPLSPRAIELNKFLWQEVIKLAA